MGYAEERINQSEAPMLIGLISDTHGYLDARVLEALKGVQAILHAGDVGSSRVLERLRRLAAVTAVRGNMDRSHDTASLPTHLDLSLAGCQIHLVHRLEDARPGPNTDVVVFGHTHRPAAERRHGVLYVNPGTAAARGLREEASVALLRIEGGRPHVEVVTLGASRLPLRGP
jgi:putative phosphoesterase